LDARGGIRSESGKFSRGRTAAEAIEVGVILQGDESVLVNMLHGALLALFYAVGRT
jgi:hypothetical protein